MESAWAAETSTYGALGPAMHAELVPLTSCARALLCVCVIKQLCMGAQRIGHCQAVAAAGLLCMAHPQCRQLTARLCGAAQFLNDWQAKLWSRFFCLSVYVTMYLNDHQRSAFYESIGLNTTQFNRRAPGLRSACGCAESVALSAARGL